MNYDELTALIEKSRATDNNKKDDIVPANRLVFSVDNGALTMTFPDGGNDVVLCPTDHAIGQLLAKLSPTVYGRGSLRQIPADYAFSIPRDLLATVLNRHCKDTPNQSWMVRGIATQCRAILAKNYPGGMNEQGAYENTQYLGFLRGFLPDEPPPDFHLARPFVDANEMVVRVIAQMDDDHQYGVGVAVSNSEVGSRKLRVLPLVQRNKCTNSIMVDRDGFSLEMVHRGSLATMRTQFKAVLGSALKASNALLDKMLEAEERELENFDSILRGIARERKWSQEVTDLVNRGTENKQTLGAIVNGITWMAHTVEGLDEPQRMEYEIAGGQMLYASQKDLMRWAVKGEDR